MITLQAPNKRFLYSLRYTISPGFHEQERMDELLRFCKSAKVDDVMLFLNAGELNPGHPYKEEVAPFMELAARVKQALSQEGVTLSLNPWVSLLHGDNGRTLRPGQPFTTMVDPFGKKAECVACPLDENFATYLSDLYAYYASIDPFAVWVEDDFRLHNHAPLGWGGCFCEKHMERYSEMAGKTLTREEFVAGILQPGTPHPYRKIWLDAGRDAMVALAARIGQAVHDVAPKCRVGLMSSSSPVHCAEGRDWPALLGALAGPTAMVNRPHLPSYVETTTQQYLSDFNALTCQCRAFVPAEAELYPEFEAYPFTRFAKSRSFMQFQVETSALLGSRGITLSLHDVMGNGNLEGEECGAALGAIKPFLEKLSACNRSVDSQRGVTILSDPRASYKLHTAVGNQMEELYPNENVWAYLLTAYSIAHKFSCDPAQKGQVVAVSGQYFRNLTVPQIKSLFSENFVLLDGSAADVLCQLGLKHLIGIKSADWHKQDSGFQAYEQVCNGVLYAGIDEARISAQMAAGNYLNVCYGTMPSIWSKLKTPMGGTAGAGFAVGENFALLPYDLVYGQLQSHLNPIRQQMIQEVLETQKKAPCPAFVIGSPYIGVYEYELAGKCSLVLVNACRDDVTPLQIHISKTVEGWSTISRDCLMQPDAGVLFEKGRLIYKQGLASLEVRVFLEQ